MNGHLLQVLRECLLLFKNPSTASGHVIGEFVFGGVIQIVSFFIVLNVISQKNDFGVTPRSYMKLFYEAGILNALPLCFMLPIIALGTGKKNLAIL